MQCKFIPLRNPIFFRALKPENILLVSANDPTSIKVAGFGLAIEDTSDSIAETVGSTLYMAPEIIKLLPYGTLDCTVPIYTNIIS